MAITRGKMERFHFYTSLKSGNSSWSWFHFYTSLKLCIKLCLKPVSFLHKLEMETNYAWKLVPFLHKLEKKIRYAWKIGKIRHSPSMVTQFEVHAPQASVHMKSRWSEGSNYEIKERLDWDFTRSNQRLELNRNVFHYFWTRFKRTILRTTCFMV